MHSGKNIGNKELAIGLVVKLSCSNIEAGLLFYSNLGFIEDTRYRLTQDGQFGMQSYVQLVLPGMGYNIAFGLFKDIHIPLTDSATGTAPTIVVDDIESFIKTLKAQHVSVSKINSNTSDSGYTDHFAFFNDPDNNQLCVRENIKNN